MIPKNIHHSRLSDIDHLELLQEVTRQTPGIYLGFQALESSQSLSERVEQFILESISGNGKNGVIYFQGLLLAYAILEFHKEWNGIDGDDQWYILLEEKLAILIESEEEYLIGENFIDPNAQLGIGKKDQWGFLGDITQRVHEQLSE